MGVFFTNFKDEQGIANEYGSDSHEYSSATGPTKADILHDLEGAVIYLAWYGYGDYCGSSLVVYEKDGKLYGVNGSHCSCSGLEGQWWPEETSWKALASRSWKVESSYADEGEAEAYAHLERLIAEHIK